MVYHIQLFKGIFHPRTYLYQLKESEKTSGLFSRLTLLLLLSVVISLVSSFFGLDSEHISTRLTDLQNGHFEWQKTFFGLGKVLGAVIYPALFLFFFSVAFWIFTNETEFKDVFILHVFVLFIHLLEDVLTLPFRIMIGLDSYSSPFSLGILGQYLTDNHYIIHFLGGLSLFQLWGIVFQVLVLNMLAENSLRYIVGIVLGMNLFIYFVIPFVIDLKIYNLL